MKFETSKFAIVSRTELLALLFICGFCFFYGLGAFGLVGADEPRYAQIAREMLERHDFVTPRLHGEVWLEKPVLYYWQAALAFRIFGVHDWAARVPCAVFASLMVLGVFFFVRRFRPGAEFDAAIVTAASAAILGFARAASTDMLLAAPFTVAMLCWYAWYETTEFAKKRLKSQSGLPVEAPDFSRGKNEAQENGPSGPALIGADIRSGSSANSLGRVSKVTVGEAAGAKAQSVIGLLAARLKPCPSTKAFLPLLFFYFLLAVGTLAKGPVAPGLAVCILVLFAALRREWRLLKNTLSIPGIVLYCVVALPWYIAVQLRNPQFFRTFFLQHNLERFATNRYQHSQPFWYYGPVLLASLIPWLVFAVPALWEALRGLAAQWRARNSQTQPAGENATASHDALPEFLILWAIFPVLFFSISRSKLPGYILPAIPPCAILAGMYLFRRRNAAERVPRPMIVLHALLVGLLGGATVLAPHFALAPKAQPPQQAVLIAAAVAIALAIFLLIGMRRAGFNAVRPFTTVAVVLFVWFILRVAGPSIDAVASARPVEDLLESLPAKERTVAVFHARRDVEFGLGFYRNQAIASYDRGEIPQAAHILLTYKVPPQELENTLHGRHATWLAEYLPQKLQIYWVGP